jgi:diamine N-acetyltransferase
MAEGLIFYSQPTRKIQIMNFKLENQHIGISETIAKDIGLIFKIENEQENKIFVMPYDKNQHLQVIDSKDEEHLTVWDKETGKIIGFIILAGLTNLNLSLEFRRIVVQSKGKGFGRQCMQLIKAYCFKKLKFHRLWLDVFEDNERAINLYKSEGFQVDGTFREVAKQGDKYRSLFLLSILDYEYFQQQLKKTKEENKR